MEILAVLPKLSKARYYLTHTAEVWREVRVAFIPKTGQQPTAEIKSYPLIRFSLFLLKLIDKLIDLHIRSGTFSEKQLLCKQFAYQA